MCFRRHVRVMQPSSVGRLKRGLGEARKEHLTSAKLQGSHIRGAEGGRDDSRIRNVSREWDDTQNVQGSGDLSQTIHAAESLFSPVYIYKEKTLPILTITSSHCKKLFTSYLPIVSLPAVCVLITSVHPDGPVSCYDGGGRGGNSD